MALSETTVRGAKNRRRVARLREFRSPALPRTAATTVAWTKQVVDVVGEEIRFVQKSKNTNIAISIPHPTQRSVSGIP